MSMPISFITGNRLRPNKTCHRAGTEDFEPIGVKGTQQSFGHLAPSGVAGAQNQDAFFHEQQDGPQQAAAAGF